MGNFLCGDVEPSAALGRLAPFVRYVHAKDFIVKEGAAPTRAAGSSAAGAAGICGGPSSATAMCRWRPAWAF